MFYTTEKKNNNLDELKVSGFGYEIIREYVIPDLLGKDSANILYWAGKNLAKKFPLNNLEEIITFFAHAGWGQLKVLKQGKNEMEFELSGELITYRFEIKETCTFQLEAGFIAQQTEMQKKQITEAYEQQKKRHQKVSFIVKWDQLDII